MKCVMLACFVYNAEIHGARVLLYGTCGAMFCGDLKTIIIMN